MQDNSSKTISINDNEDRYRILVDLSPDAMIVTVRGKVAYANSSAMEMWEASDQSDLVGMTETELVRSDYRDLSGKRQSEITVGEIYARHLTSEPVSEESTNCIKLPNVEFVIQTLKGSEKLVESSGVVARFNGEPSAIFVVRDISERKQLGNALQRSEARFRALVEGAPQAIVAIDEQGLIVLVNDQCEQLFGYKKYELIGEDLSLLIPEKLRHSHSVKFSEFFPSPRSRKMGVGLKLDARHKGGILFPVEISLSSIFTCCLMW